MNGITMYVASILLNSDIGLDAATPSIVRFSITDFDEIVIGKMYVSTSSGDDKYLMTLTPTDLSSRSRAVIPVSFREFRGQEDPNTYPKDILLFETNEQQVVIMNRLDYVLTLRLVGTKWFIEWVPTEHEGLRDKSRGYVFTFDYQLKTPLRFFNSDVYTFPSTTPSTKYVLTLDDGSFLNISRGRVFMGKFTRELSMLSIYTSSSTRNLYTIYTYQWNECMTQECKDFYVSDEPYYLILPSANDEFYEDLRTRNEIQGSIGDVHLSSYVCLYIVSEGSSTKVIIEKTIGVKKTYLCLSPDEITLQWVPRLYEETRHHCVFTVTQIP
jgi:hypothetical protein